MASFPFFSSDNVYSSNVPNLISPGSPMSDAWTDPMNPTHIFPMDNRIRDPYTPSEDGQTPPFSTFPSPMHKAIAHEFPAFSNFPLENFDQLQIGAHDSFHPSENPPPSPQPVLVLGNQSLYTPECASGHVPVVQALDPFGSPDDLQEFLQMPEQTTDSVDPPSRHRRWSSGGDDDGNFRRLMSGNSSSSTKLNSYVSRSLEQDHLAHSLASRAPQSYHPHILSTGVDASFNRDSAPYIVQPSHIHTPAAVSPSQIYNQQSPQVARSSHHHGGSSANYSVHPHAFYNGYSGLPAHSEGSVYHRTRQTSAPSPAQPAMVKPTVTSRAVRNASNTRIRHEAKHLCPHCPERFTTSGNLRNHTNSHFGIKPYRCPQLGCGREFVTKSDCKRHQGKVH